MEDSPDNNQILSSPTSFSVDPFVLTSDNWLANPTFKIFSDSCKMINLFRKKRLIDFLYAIINISPNIVIPVIFWIKGNPLNYLTWLFLINGIVATVAIILIGLKERYYLYAIGNSLLSLSFVIILIVISIIELLDIISFIWKTNPLTDLFKTTIFFSTVFLFVIWIIRSIIPKSLKETNRADIISLIKKMDNSLYYSSLSKSFLSTLDIFKEKDMFYFLYALKKDIKKTLLFITSKIYHIPEFILKDLSLNSKELLEKAEKKGIYSYRNSCGFFNIDAYARNRALIQQKKIQEQLHLKELEAKEIIFKLKNQKKLIYLPPETIIHKFEKIRPEEFEVLWEIANRCFLEEGQQIQSSLKNIGLKFEESNKYEEAYKILQFTENWEDLARICLKIAEVSLTKENYNRAKEFFEKTLDYHQKNHTQNVAVRVKLEVIKTFLEGKRLLFYERFSEAYNLLREVEQDELANIIKEYTLKLYLAICMEKIGKEKEAKNYYKYLSELAPNPRKALEFLNKAIKLSEILGKDPKTDDELMDKLKNLAKTSDEHQKAVNS